MSIVAIISPESRVRLAQRLRQARDEFGLTQAQVCQLVGCTVRSITRWEAGTCEPGVLTTQLLASLYKVSLDWIVGRPAKANHARLRKPPRRRSPRPRRGQKTGRRRP
jgi:transcriptional regulator with XRE-family HTH domain